MAGFRLSQATACPGQTVPPRQRVARVERARQRLGLRYESATTGLERFAAVTDHVRLLMKRAAVTDQVRTEHLLREVIERLLMDARELERIEAGAP
jgi:hypothetical protein